MNEDYTKKILQFQDVISGYRDTNVLRGVNFSMGKGEFVYLIGKTGAGKSSILKLIYADLKPKSGTVLVGDHDIGTIKSKDVPFLRRRLGIVFQDFQLLPDRNVFDNIRFAMRATGWKDKKRMKTRGTELLAKVGLSAKMQSMPHQLSGGEQQRVTIARALINDPIILLADEPTGNLDPDATDMIMEILFRINLAGTSVIMATHEHELIRKYPARTLECRDGLLIDHKMDFA
ncbi:MAG: ATP-binding cassette domain-containing protein [Bacteroidota bacterium]